MLYLRASPSFVTKQFPCEEATIRFAAAYIAIYFHFNASLKCSFITVPHCLRRPQMIDYSLCVVIVDGIKANNNQSHLADNTLNLTLKQKHTPPSLSRSPFAFMFICVHVFFLPERLTNSISPCLAPGCVCSPCLPAVGRLGTRITA